MKTALCTIFVALCVEVGTPAQGFINLDFEQAIIQPVYPGDFLTLDPRLALPGWNFGTSVLFYRESHLGVEPLYMLLDSTNPAYAPGMQLAGNYSVLFASGYAGNDPSGPWHEAFITQSGLIPISAQSVRLLAEGPFQVFIGAVQVPMFSLGGNSYGGDVSAFAGTTARLWIVNSAIVGHLGGGTIVDNIQFSPAPIPEPGSMVVFALGAAVLLWQMWKANRT